ncbi:trimeric intracellular cation channel family protein [Parasphingorhabdus sp. DH2-15]|uniref:trimeric intracellular cation channel family protein n=1 Tax=Parasphingorhabdus sp. DH2-15 TaxID=3444112 RepID=UPI003F6852AE
MFLANFPTEDLIGPILLALNILGIAVFAATGALAAARKEQTIVTFIFFALVTGVGGGTIRDLLIGAPVFWIIEQTMLISIFVMVVIIWITPAKWWRGKMMDWLDAIGLVAYSVYGTAKSLQYGVPPIPAAMMGVITACAGGIIRDVLAGVPSIVLRPEVYVTAAALSAGMFVIFLSFNMLTSVAAVVAALFGFFVRAAAIRYGLALPSYRGSKDAEAI